MMRLFVFLAIACLVAADNAEKGAVEEKARDLRRHYATSGGCRYRRQNMRRIYDNYRNCNMNQAAVWNPYPTPGGGTQFAPPTVQSYPTPGTRNDIRPTTVVVPIPIPEPAVPPIDQGIDCDSITPDQCKEYVFTCANNFAFSSCNYVPTICLPHVPQCPQMPQARVAPGGG